MMVWARLDPQSLQYGSSYAWAADIPSAKIQTANAQTVYALSLAEQHQEWTQYCVHTVLRAEIDG